MAERSEKYWFRAKRFGYGWSYPLTKEGWVVYALYFIPLLVWFSWVVAHAPTNFEDETYNRVAFGGLFVLLFIMTPALMYVCVKHGEPARWRWGKRK